MSMKQQHGVSVVICCYNSAEKLPATLEHLLKQEMNPELPWEVILVDNASTDNTSDIARSLWPDTAPVPLRIVHELEPGLSYARKRGVEETRYELVSFVDDDNWLAPNWVQTVAEIMNAHPEIGACGGRTEAVFEADPPFWFDKFQHNFVVGKQAEHAGDITWITGHLWGAGLTVRKNALQELINNNFQHLLTGRKKASLTAGEDYEICYALRLAGWRLWYEPSLVLRHYMPKKRLTWDNLIKMYRGFGAQTIGHDPYLLAQYSFKEIRRFAGKIWIRKLLKSFYILIFLKRKALASILWNGVKGNTEVPGLEYYIGRIIALFQRRNKYDEDIRNIRNSKWCKLDADTVKYLTYKPNYKTTYHLSSKPLVTALICNYNYGRFLEQAIDSALAQTWRPLEVLVVDDGSTDESRSVLAQYRDRIRVILKENGGQASAFNVGIAEARGEIICFLDSDDFWYPDKVERTIAKYKEGPWGLICNDLQEVDDEGVNISTQTYTQAHSSLKSVDLLDFVEREFGWTFGTTSGMSLPREIAQQLLPLPEKEWRTCADSPVAYGAVCHAPIGIIDKPLSAYRLHGVNEFASLRRDELGYFLTTFLVHVKRYLFIKNHLSRMGYNPLEKDLKDIYLYYRSCCFIARNSPWRYLFKLWKRNLHYYFTNRKLVGLWLYKSVRYLMLDTLLIILIPLQLPKRYRSLRDRYRKEASRLSPSTRTYLEYD